MKSVRVIQNTILIGTGFFFYSSQGMGAVTWEEQADRLQRVGSSLIDAFPVEEPIPAEHYLAGKLINSFTPSINSNVGAKDENFPESPIQTVPTFEYGRQLNKGKTMQIGGRIWIGVLPPGFEKIFGIDASVFEWLVGGSVQFHFEDTLFGLNIYVPVGIQYAYGAVDGKIASKNGDDSFVTKNLGIYTGFGVTVEPLSSFFNFLVIRKRSVSTMKIFDDQTNITVTDNLQDSDFPFAFQFTIGHRMGNFVFSLSELIVPKRLNMPRMLIAYHMELD